MQNAYHCSLQSLQFLKTVREGCLAGSSGLDLSSSPSLNGPVRRPNTEITGEAFHGKISSGLKDALGQ